MKNVQMSQELYMQLLRYFLLEETENYHKIKFGLEQKLDAMVRHQLYTKYKTAPTEEECEKARQEYLDQRGVWDSFRW